MNKKYTDEELIEYLEGTENPALQKQIDQDLALKKRVEELSEILQSIANTSDFEPPASIGSAVSEAIFEEQIRSSKSSSFSWMQVAAAIAILLVGFSIGKFSGNNTGSSDELEALMSEVRELKGLTLKATLKNHSASERIMAVNQIQGDGGSVNVELLQTLINTLNTDESPNVRYQALQALSNFLDQEIVRAALVKSLEKQSDPLIQISLITVLVNASEYGARKPIEKIIENENTSLQVKQQAEIALKILS